jgi:hypothetical protein
MSDDVAVRNASDPQQVKAAGKRAAWARRQELEDVRAVLALPGGRRLIWRLLERCRVFESIAAPTAETTYYNAGQQDVGHFLMAEVAAAQPAALTEMMQARQGQTMEQPEHKETDDGE